RGLTRAFDSAADGAAFEPRGGTFALPFGTLEVAFDPADLLWDGRRLTGFVPVADLQVRGLHNRYRWPGLGAPLAAGTEPLRREQGFQVGPRVKVPVTALLLLDRPRRQLSAGGLRGTLRLVAATDDEPVSIAGRTVPIEVEPTAALAYTLSTPEVWQTELAGFLRGDLLRGRPTNLAAMQPHRPGRFPVVFVHGTASSAGRWADLVNDLTSDPAIRDRFEFWFFQYETGNPIPYSALQLRDALTAAVERLDPAGRDPALREMVVIGHSQGGLLTKMTAIDTAEGQFWDRFSRKPPEELRLRPETRDLLRRALFIEPLPFVRRLVFVATPHGGSYLTEWSVTGVIARLVRLPLTLTRATAELVTLNADALRFDPGRARFGSLFGMTPGSPLITALADVPVAPGVAAHSIVAVEGDGPVAEGGDGVVKYASAHIDGVESELVVRSGHSVQGNPHTVEEVRRILLLHAGEACAERGVGCPAPGPEDAPAGAERGERVSGVAGFRNYASRRGTP
ncbi:MAG TPA: hypothetical protein VFG47_00645, partial [Geminicoccaceae bacterium]|nr:hypothetical protein [Geminicoccaceae bacterium]